MKSLRGLGLSLDARERQTDVFKRMDVKGNMFDFGKNRQAFRNNSILRLLRVGILKASFNLLSVWIRPCDKRQSALCVRRERRLSGGMRPRRYDYGELHNSEAEERTAVDAMIA